MSLDNFVRDVILECHRNANLRLYTNISLVYNTTQYTDRDLTEIRVYGRGAKQGGVGGSQPPLNFGWGGGLNTCQPPLVLRRFLLGGVGPP